MLTTLTPLQGHVAAIHASSFFHLFDEAGQRAAAHALASLLSPQSGSMILGKHTSSSDSKECTVPVVGWRKYSFAPADWRALWEGEVFERGKVRVEAALVDNSPWRGRGFERDAPEAREDRRSMVWCVKRL